jgi:hypothetical protein
MTTLIEAARQALEALEDACGGRCNAEYNPCFQREAITSLRQAIEQAHKHEPVIDKSAAIRIATVLGWTPPRQPLLDEQIKQIWLNGKDHGDDWLDVQAIARAIEAAHGIKENT